MLSYADSKVVGKIVLSTLPDERRVMLLSYLESSWTVWQHSSVVEV